MIKLKSAKFNAKHFAAGDIIACEGKRSESFYLLIDGCVRIYKDYQRSEKKALQTIEGYGFFGESAFFGERKFSETFVAQMDCSILPLDRIEAYKFFMFEPETSVLIFNALFDRVRELYLPLLSKAATAVTSKKKYESSPDLFFPTGGDFYNFSINKTEESYFKTYKAQSEIIKEEKRINNLYIVLKGSTGIYSGRKKIADIRPGNFICNAIFPDGIATETYAASKDSEMLELSQENIEKFFKTEPKSAFAVLKMLCGRIELLINAIDVMKYGRQILPMNHKKYNIKIETDMQHVQNKYFFCPVCQNSFQSLIVNAEQMLSISSDDDSRMYYEGVEPLFYDVISCSKCWYTALKEYFDKGRATLQYFQKTMEPYKSVMQYNVDKSTYNIDDVFLSYYFAMFCVNECYNTGRSLIHAKLWLRLSWLYNICGDEDQEMAATKKAREFFLAAFSESNLDEGRQAMFLMIVMGVVCFKVGDRKNAKFFLSQVVLKSGVDKYKEKAKSLLKKYDLL